MVLRYRRFPAELLALFLLLLIVAGCGVKGDPEPPESVRPVSPRLLAATVGPDSRVRLEWKINLPDGVYGLPAVFVVERAQVPEEGACETCPLRFETAGQVPVSRYRERGYAWEDTVSTGFRYTYRISSESVLGIRGKKSVSTTARVMEAAVSGAPMQQGTDAVPPELNEWP